MNKEQVPQDKNQTYSGNNKVIYATNKQGGYEKVLSSGWEVEEATTLMAVDALKELAQQAYFKAQSGKSSPLEFHMHNKRFDVLSLSQSTGFFQWQIKRHFKPVIFTKLSARKKIIYHEALGITEKELNSIPEQAPAL